MTWQPGQGLVIPTQWGNFIIAPGGFATLLLAYVLAFPVNNIVRRAMAGEQHAKYATWALYVLAAFMTYNVFKPLIIAATGIA